MIQQKQKSLNLDETKESDKKPKIGIEENEEQLKTSHALS